MQPSRLFEEFPAPSYRGNQESALASIQDAFDAGNRVVLVRAPTGSGKSLLARAIMGCARRAEAAEPHQATGAYYTTPQVSQLEDVAEDDLLSDLNVIRGKSNYTCILQGERDTPVDRAPCARRQGFDCTVQHRCPYYADRAIASARRYAATTLAYFMQTAGSEVFRKRDVVVIDEAHGLAEWAEMYATIELSPDRVPVWDGVGVPDVHADAREDEDALDRTARFAETLVGVCERAKDDLLAKPELTPAEAARRDRLQELVSELSWFLEGYRDPESTTTWVVDQPDGEGSPITIKPLDPARYLRHTVWDRGNRFALLSATILSKDAFCRSVGLDPATVALVDVDHTFPLGNRPLYDVTQGKMTFEHREETLPKIARLLVRLMAAHPDEKGIVHAHSYAIADGLADRLGRAGVAARLRTHGRGDRDAALEGWMDADDPEVFLAVKMEEALDLRGDLARWQVLCKAPYLNTGDSRVARRLEEGQWAWYHRVALRTVVQACGRVVRAPDDYGATYLADSSILDLFERASADVPPWFADAIDAMERPELPPFDPDAALSGIDAEPGGSAGRRGGSTRASTGGKRGQKSGSVNGGGTDGGSPDEGGTTSRNDHPLSDVWGE
ncbi:MAG: ATP-dependent DNA helicase [Haloferacaceae archaeon]